MLMLLKASYEPNTIISSSRFSLENYLVFMQNLVTDTFV